jgi:predicted SAM-dependent methyltransferase
MARAAITLAVIAMFIAIRADIAADLYARVATFYRQQMAPRIINEYLKNHAVRKLQIGAGPSNLQGWLNTDIEPSDGQAYFDATAAFHLPDGSMHYVFAEQLIEHLTYEQGLSMLKECRRVLKSGGRIRIATPNLDRLIDLFGPMQTEQMKAYVPRELQFHAWPTTADNECYILNQQMRQWGHQFVYSPKMLQAHFEVAGFQEITTQRPGESADPNLTGIDLRARGEVRFLNEYDVMVFEAVRP